MVGIDTDAHTGLRGVASIWIMVFHSLIFSDIAVDLEGSSLMPLFFLLSGFSLMLTYPPESATNNPKAPSLWDICNFVRDRAFYQNRFARTYPVFFLWTIIAVPLWQYGYGLGPPHKLPTALFSNLLLISTAACFQLGLPINGPSWTICTLFVIWLFFSYFAARARSLSDEQLVRNVIRCYWLQMILLFIVFIPFAKVMGLRPAFVFSTTTPWTRFPVFEMGVYAAELCMRARDRPLHWPGGFLLVFPSSKVSTIAGIDEADADDADKKRWIQQADDSSWSLLVLTLSVAFGDLLLRLIFLRPGRLMGGLWLQAVVPFAQVTVLVALVRDGGFSKAGRFLRQKWLQWLGKISMAIYLVHFPVQWYLLFAHNRGMPLSWADWPMCIRSLDGCNKLRILPYHLIPAMWAISLLLAAATFYYVEEPLRKMLRFKNRSLASGPNKDSDCVREKLD